MNNLKMLMMSKNSKDYKEVKERLVLFRAQLTCKIKNIFSNKILSVMMTMMIAKLGLMIIVAMIIKIRAVMMSKTIQKIIAK